jgi:iron-sulfur cluster insertion protein
MLANENLIDKSKVKIPTILFTSRAMTELKLIIENDFTLAGKYFRLVISGKGCDGFTYSAGFTDLTDEDLMIKVESLESKKLMTKAEDELFVLVDPFAAFYLSEVTVDFVQDLEKGHEGFVITNHHQKEFQGKFWKKNPEKTPPMKDHSSEASHA